MLWLDEKDYRAFQDDKQKQLPARVANYKEMHKGTASNKGVLRDFLAARTLTEMRKILWGGRK
jgi:hypothetical protein